MSRGRGRSKRERERGREKKELLQHLADLCFLRTYFLGKRSSLKNVHKVSLENFAKKSVERLLFAVVVEVLVAVGDISFQLKK